MRLIAATCVLLLCTSCHSNNAPIVGTTAATSPAPARPTVSLPRATEPTLAKWTAISSTAMGVTGDIEKSPDVLVIQRQRFPLTPVRTLSPTDLANAASILNTKITATSTGSLAKMRIPSQAQLKNGNTACGKQDVTWILTLRDTTKTGADLWIAMFSGDAEPDLTPAAVNNSTSLCGTYWYQQGQ